MKVVGIIAEYNPFHNGHAYQIKRIKEELKPDYILIAMSGDFVQRGTPAITDKYTRSAMALACGADLVLELPTLWATSSAEYFASAGVSLMEKTKVVDTLCFGAECDNLPLLTNVAHVLSEKDPSLEALIATLVSEGNSYPVARNLALHKKYDFPGLDELLKSPNNILAIEYLKAMTGTPLMPHIIRRNGDDYHATTATGPLTSATAIRQLLKNGTLEKAEEYLPSDAAFFFREALLKQQYLLDDDLSQALGYALLQNLGKYEEYADCSRELADKITSSLPGFEGFHSFCELLKTKEITYSRISRALLHILLQHTKKDYDSYKGMGYIPYLRILGFRKESAPLLRRLKEEATVPMISKVADASTLLSKDAYALLQKDLQAAELYNQLIRVKTGVHIPNDFSHEIVIFAQP